MLLAASNIGVFLTFRGLYLEKGGGLDTVCERQGGESFYKLFTSLGTHTHTRRLLNVLGFKDTISRDILPPLIVCYFSQQTTAGTETSQKTRITGTYMYSSVRISPANSHRNILENWQIEDPPIAPQLYHLPIIFKTWA